MVVAIYVTDVIFVAFAMFVTDVFFVVVAMFVADVIFLWVGLNDTGFCVMPYFNFTINRILSSS